MSIVLRPDPEPDPAASGGITETYERQNTLTDKLYQMSPFIYHELTGTNEIPKGFVYYHGGSKYECTVDEAITGTPSNYIVFTQSLDGLTATAEYISQATFASDFSWNDSFCGYYNGEGELCIPAEFEEAANGNISSPHLYVGRLGKVLGGRTNFSTGQGGTAGTAILQQIGYDVQEEVKTKILSIHVDTDTEHNYIRRTTRAPSLTTSLQWWHLAYIPINMSNEGVCRLTVDVYIPSIGKWKGTLEIIAIGEAGTVPIIRVISSYRDYAISDYQYEPQFRTLYPASGVDTGIYIQIGLKSSGTETGGIVAYMNENEALSSSELGFVLYVSASGTADGTPTYLPDGSTAPVAGTVVYGFGQSFVQIWSGNQSLSGSSYGSTFFTGFSNQIFNRYLFLLSTASNGDDVFEVNISKRAIAASNWIDGATYYYFSGGAALAVCRIEDSADSNDFLVTETAGLKTVYLRYIYGAND